MKISTKIVTALSIGLLSIAVVPQANAKSHFKPIKGKKAIEKCVSKWEKVYHSQPGWEDHLVNYDQINEWENWCKKGRTPQNYKP